MYGHSVFVLCGPPERYGHNGFVSYRARNDAMTAAETRLRKEIYDDRNGVLPMVGALRDVVPTAVDMRW